MEGTGDYGRYDRSAQASMAGRANQAIKVAERDHAHLWVATVSYRITNPALPTQNLDHESLFIPPGVGCVVCEVQYAPGMERTACPGEPR